MVSWYRERIDAIIDGQTAGWTVADKRRLRERFIALRHSALTERNAADTAGRVGIEASSTPIRSVSAATLTEREVESADQSGLARGAGSLNGGEQRCRHPQALPASRSVNAATLDEARRLVLSLRVSSSAVTQTPSAPPRSTP